MINQVNIRVRYAETDAMGIAHHSSYLAWLEVARGEFLRGLGFSYKEVEEKGVLLPVLSAELCYNHPVYYDDPLTIMISVRRLTVARIVFDYRIVRKGKCVTTASTQHAFTSSDLKPINLSKALPNLWAALQETLSGK